MMFHVLSPILLAAWITSGAGGASLDAKPSEGVQMVKVPWPPIIPRFKPFPALDTLFANAKPGKTTEIDLSFWEPFKSWDFYYDIRPQACEVKRGTITLHTKEGYLRFNSKSRSVACKPAPELPEETLVLVDRGCGFQILMERPAEELRKVPEQPPSSRIYISNFIIRAADGRSIAQQLAKDMTAEERTRSVPFEYVSLELPVSRNDGYWKVHVKFTLSPDYEGHLAKWGVGGHGK